MMFLYICQDLKSLLMLKKAILLILIILGCSNRSNAQFSSFYHEIGIMAGPVFFKSDFGERGDFENFIKNNGFSIGGFYYLTPAEDFPSLKENFKLRLEGSYMKSELEHYGKYVDNKSASLFTRQLRAMKGEISVVSFGVQVEYYPWKMDDYNRGSDFSPFVAAGVQGNTFSTRISSDLGPLGTSETTPEKYMNAYRNDNGFAASVTGGFGGRYKLGFYHAIIAEFKLQYYFSDWVDGINPDKKIYTENQSNDWSTAISVGYVFYIN